MKFLCFLLFGFCICTKSYSQLNSRHCKKLEKKVFFKSIRFGDHIPPGLVACNRPEKGLYGYMVYDSLSPGCKKKYSDIFNFLSMHLPMVRIATNDSGRIDYVELASFIDNEQYSDSINYDPPKKFTKIYKKLVSKFGTPTGIKEASYHDSVLIRYHGFPRIIYWVCNYMEIELKVTYGARDKIWNLLNVSIKDRHFEFIEEDKSLQ